MRGVWCFCVICCLLGGSKGGFWFNKGLVVLGYSVSICCGSSIGSLAVRMKQNGRCFLQPGGTLVV